MVAWLGRMAAREWAALLVWMSAAIMVTALALSYARAPHECFYSPEDFARCDPWRAIGALGDVGASVLVAAAIWSTRNPATTWLHRIARGAGVLGLGLAMIGNLGAVVGEAYLVARPSRRWALLVSDSPSSSKATAGILWSVRDLGWSLGSR